MNKKSVFGSIATALALMILVGMIFGFGYFFFRDLMKYREASRTYDQMEDFIEEQEAPAVAATEGGEEADSAVSEIELNIDYAALKAVNEDFLGVLYVPSLAMKYPIAKSHDNEEYLTRMFNGNENPSGCVFMDAQNSEEFTDPNTFIYGHNMKNGTMFGSLKKFIQEEGLCADNPYFFIYTLDHVMKYHIFAYCTVGEDDSMYDFITDRESYDAYVTHALARSMYRDPNEDDILGGRPNIVVLSTCHGAAGTTQRLVVLGAFEKFVE